MEVPFPFKSFWLIKRNSMLNFCRLQFSVLYRLKQKLSEIRVFGQYLIYIIKNINYSVSTVHLSGVFFSSSWKQHECRVIIYTFLFISVDVFALQRNKFRLKKFILLQVIIWFTCKSANSFLYVQTFNFERIAGLSLKCLRQLKCCWLVITESFCYLMPKKLHPSVENRIRLILEREEAFLLMIILYFFVREEVGK